MAKSSQFGSGAEIKASREALGLSVAVAARAAGITRQHLWSLERGRNRPSLDLARRLAGVLGVAIDTLFPPEPGEYVEDRLAAPLCFVAEAASGLVGVARDR